METQKLKAIIVSFFVPHLNEDGRKRRNM